MPPVMAVTHMIVLALVSLMASIGAAATSPSQSARGLLPQDPTHDPFYQPPAGFESQPPGSVLRSRRVQTAFFSLIPNPVEAHQLLYRTTAANGSAISTVTTVFKPWSPKTDRFVSWQTAYDSSSLQCVPSYQWQLLAPSTDFIEQHMLLTTVTSYLERGYIVASPDYEGPDAAFGAGRLSGMGVLDGMRAVNNYWDKLGLSTNNPMIMGTGYSGSGIPTGWAASLHPTYSPELNIKGWATGGVPANLTGFLDYMDGTLVSGFVPAIIAGLAKPSAYGAQLNPVINRTFTAKGRETLKSAEDACPISAFLKFPEKTIFSPKIQSLGQELFHEPTFADVLSQNTMGVHRNETPTAPVYLYHGLHDEVIPYSDVSKLAKSWCDKGANVELVTYKNGGHAALELTALPDVFKVVNATFEGDFHPGCSHTTKLNSTLNPQALGANLEPLLTKVIQDLTDAPSKDNIH